MACWPSYTKRFLVKRIIIFFLLCGSINEVGVVRAPPIKVGGHTPSTSVQALSDPSLLLKNEGDRYVAPDHPTQNVNHMPFHSVQPGTSASST